MRDETIYHEYANWKLENEELIRYLIQNNSDLIVRFRHVIDVTDYLYDKLIDDPNFTEEENYIFETGFYYLFDQMDEIITLLNKSYGNDIEQLEKRAKDVNLLLSTIDFQNEIIGVEDYKQEDLDRLVNFEQSILTKLERKEEVPKSMFEELDRMTFEMFKRLDVNYYPVNDIYLEIADELGIL
ncbi:MAG: hypothetical protein ACLFTZ_06145 [Acholeplasmataceae bacterium]